MQPGISRRTAGILILLLALGAAACAASAASPAAQNAGEQLGGRDQGAQPAAGASAAASAGTGGSVTDAQAFAALADRQIIKTGEVTVEVDNVATSLGRVRALATELGGYVGGSQAGTLEDSASLTLRIPADRFEDGLTRLHELDGKVLSESTREEDVTSQIVDLDARIKNLEASERQYRALVERATAVDDILAVQTRLDAVRGEIEQLSAQLEQLSGLAGLSTLTVTLSPSPTPVERATEDWDPGATFENATAALVGIGQSLADILIWLGIVGVPLLIVLAVATVVVARVLPLARRRLPVPPTE